MGAEETPDKLLVASPDPVTPPPPESPSDKHARPPHSERWSIGRLFWGLLLVLVGSLILADNFGFVTVNWAELWRLWPLVIIAAGLSVLSLRRWIWRMVTLILVLVTLAAVVWVAVGNYSVSRPMSVHEVTVQQLSSDIKQAEVTVKAGASTLRINTAQQSSIAKVKLESNVAGLSYGSSRSGDTQRINFSMDGSNRWWVGDVRSSWTIDLTRSLPLNLNVDAGASDTVINLSQAQLRSATLKAGASSLVLKLGDRENTTTVSIDSGASSVVLQVPATSGVRLKLEGGLSSKQLADLQEVGKDTYESPKYAQASKKLDISGKISVASFTIERY